MRNRLLGQHARAIVWNRLLGQHAAVAAVQLKPFFQRRTRKLKRSKHQKILSIVTWCYSLMLRLSHCARSKHVATAIQATAPFPLVVTSSHLLPSCHCHCHSHCLLQRTRHSYQQPNSHAARHTCPSMRVTCDCDSRSVPSAFGSVGLLQYLFVIRFIVTTTSLICSVIPPLLGP